VQKKNQVQKEKKERKMRKLLALQKNKNK